EARLRVKYLCEPGEGYLCHTCRLKSGHGIISDGEERRGEPNDITWEHKIENLSSAITQRDGAYGPARLQNIPAAIGLALADEFSLSVDFPSRCCEGLQGCLFLGRQGGEILDLLEEPIGVLLVVCHTSTSSVARSVHLFLAYPNSTDRRHPRRHGLVRAQLVTQSCQA